MTWELCCQKQVSQAGISNYIPQFIVGCNYLSLPEIPASGNKFLTLRIQAIAMLNSVERCDNAHFVITDATENPWCCCGVLGYRGISSMLLG